MTSKYSNNDDDYKSSGISKKLFSWFELCYSYYKQYMTWRWYFVIDWYHSVNSIIWDQRSNWNITRIIVQEQKLPIDNVTG